jgi:hypothetical protein
MEPKEIPGIIKISNILRQGNPLACFLFHTALKTL